MKDFIERRVGIIENMNEDLVHKLPDDGESIRIHREIIIKNGEYLSTAIEEVINKIIEDIEKVRDLEPESNGRYNACTEIINIIKK